MRVKVANSSGEDHPATVRARHLVGFGLVDSCSDLCNVKHRLQAALCTGEDQPYLGQPLVFYVRRGFGQTLMHTLNPLVPTCWCATRP